MYFHRYHLGFLILLSRITITLNSAALQFNILYKYLSNKKFFDERSGRAERLRIWSCQKFHLPQCCKSRQAKIVNDMAKVSIKSEKITLFGGIFHVRELFSVTLAQLSTKFQTCGVCPTATSTARLRGRCQSSTTVTVTAFSAIQALIEGRKSMSCGAIHIILRDNRCSVRMFAYSQTNVCLQANKCFPAGKLTNGASIAPQGILLCPSINT